MSKITKNMVIKAIEMVEKNISNLERDSEACGLPKIFYARLIAKEKNDLSALNCVINCDFPANSKCIKEIVARLGIIKRR